MTILCCVYNSFADHIISAVAPVVPMTTAVPLLLFIGLEWYDTLSFVRVYETYGHVRITLLAVTRTGLLLSTYGHTYPTLWWSYYVYQ